MGDLCLASGKGWDVSQGTPAGCESSLADFKLKYISEDTNNPFNSNTESVNIPMVGDWLKQ